MRLIRSIWWILSDWTGTRFRPRVEPESHQDLSESFWSNRSGVVLGNREWWRVKLSLGLKLRALDPADFKQIWRCDKWKSSVPWPPSFPLPSSFPPPSHCERNPIPADSNFYVWCIDIRQKEKKHAGSYNTYLCVFQTSYVHQRALNLETETSKTKRQTHRSYFGM